MAKLKDLSRVGIGEFVGTQIFGFLKKRRQVKKK